MPLYTVVLEDQSGSFLELVLSNIAKKYKKRGLFIPIPDLRLENNKKKTHSNQTKTNIATTLWLRIRVKRA